MKNVKSTSALAQLATRVDKFVTEIDLNHLNPATTSRVLVEIDGLIEVFRQSSEELVQALGRLRDAVEHRPARGGPVVRNDLVVRRLRRLLRDIALLMASGIAMTALPAAAADPAPVVVPTLMTVNVQVGDSVTNPATGATETVLEVLNGYWVRTGDNNVILLAQTVGDSFSATIDDPAAPGTPKTVTYTVTAVTLTDGRLTSVKLTDGTAVSTSNVVTSIGTEVADGTPSTGGGTNGGTTYTFDTALGDVKQFTDVRKGGNGGDGRDGGGVQVCIPLLGCATIAYYPTAGGQGAAGPNFEVDVPLTHGNITTVSNNLPGIIVVSNGGNGGEGGIAIGNIPAARGGNAGSGGNVTARNYVDVVTTGENSHGMLVQSSAGIAGSGGGCYIACTGGGGGSAGSGGDAFGYNFGNISTTGKGAVGMLVQSLGGDAGTGGSSFGIVGSGGSGGVGSNGGTAYARNEGFINTTGEAAHGVMAQSIGGIGGNSGAAVGVVAFGGTGGGAGDGGTSEASASGTSRTITAGDFAYGIFSQSVGGGGGVGSISGGIVSFGATGGAAGVGGTAKVSIDDGAYIQTSGKGSYGVFAQSVGGMGGTAHGTGGIFTMGGTGGVGANGGKVEVVSGGTIVTGADGDGEDARGVFAQSVGGGGGSANASGGVVSLGGDGSAAGNGGEVKVKLTAASSITTKGAGADGVYAQSVGGGGGSGASSGGVLAIGGEGDSGGTGGTVTVENDGSITTGGKYSRGIFVQSVGGGGGSGGDGAGLASIGGKGSATSAGGDVIVTNRGTILTTGSMSSGIQGQSIGGGGGDGGTSGGMFLAIGGAGGGGGAAGTVTINNSGSIATTGTDSHGIIAQAIGGGGGNGGSSTSVSLFAGVAIGGSGSGGGDGGTASVNFSPAMANVGGVPTLLNPTITTGSDRSRGVFVQSIGGGGGNGGSAVQVAAGVLGSVSIAIGGSGAGGGTGGTVNVNGDVNVFTKGKNSEGIYAQSVGGGGGNGGYTIATAVTLGDGAALAIGIGGRGAGGGAGGTVNMDSGGNIVTQGQFSTGLMAQSVGGGGGSGGFNISASAAAGSLAALAVSVGIGGSAGTGGEGGTVNAIFDGAIATGGEKGAGSDSVGAIIQSIGGGGGRGGMNISGAAAIGGIAAVGVSVGLGGTGGGGGDGGKVTGEIGGDVVTTGARSTGVLIQSAGGGGGSGGFNVSGTITVAGGGAGGMSFGLGGAGGGGGAGGEVTGTTGGKVTTFGDDSDGVVIQSVGGGGGSGGFNVSANVGITATAAGGVSVGLGGSGGTGGIGSAVTGTIKDNVVTSGDRSRGVLVQSTGGGGGAGGFNISGNLQIGGSTTASIGVGIGGSGGSGGSAGKVIASAKSISTDGVGSAGFIAQSVGGGGGAGGFNITGNIAMTSGFSGTIGIGIGGSGGNGGAGGEVDAVVIGDVLTSGAKSTAVLAQSVGGGGGFGGFDVTGSINSAGMGAGSINVGIGGSGGSGGNADKVTLAMTGQAVTNDVSSDGIVAQSLGGGGGTGGFTIATGVTLGGATAGTIGIGIGGSGGGGGNAGLVTLKVNEGTTASNPALFASTTLEDSSRGVLAQSVGGGGGSGGFNITGGVTLTASGGATVGVGIGGSGGRGGNAGDVIANISGRTWTEGDGSDGVTAQSLGGGGGNGGFTIAGGLTASGAGGGTISVGIGGSGGDGGQAGAVTLGVNAGVVTPTTSLIAAVTKGVESRGIIAQSVGGGGGNGAFNVSGAVSLASTGASTVTVGIGGSGGKGGDAGKAGAGSKAAGDLSGLSLTDADYSVNATINGRTATSGAKSDAIIAQSVGGGGGNGGFVVSAGLALSGAGAGAVSVGIGGSGGEGGDGGAVKFRLNEGADARDTALFAATSENVDSRGIIIQSMGGAGGNGGFNISGGLALGTSGSGAVSVGIGGSGGGGGNSAAVNARITGRTATIGARSDAVLAQSVGGGGGNGAFNVSGAVALAGGAAGAVSVGIGGSGSDGGISGAVTLGVNQGVLMPTLDLIAASTEGPNSRGIVAQSLGGGGGVGAFNVSGALGLASQQGGTVSVGIGGSGGGGGDANAVSLAIQGRTTTLRESSDAVVAQSVGGGGGNGDFNVTAGIAGASVGAGSIGVGIGGSGGGGGDAAKVSLVINSGVTANSELLAAITGGAYSRGVIAQSLGGGGGIGAFNVTGGISLGGKGAGTVGVGIGGTGGYGGNAGEVDAKVSGRTHTTGLKSDAVLAQSVGGGGGSGAFNVTGGITVGGDVAGTVSVGIGGSGGRGGSSDAVALAVNEGILVPAVDLIAASTRGDQSRGIVAQSIGGGGGDGAFNVTGQINGSKKGAGGVAVGIGGSGGDGGTSGSVSLAVQGRTITQGNESGAVLAQSVGGGGGNGSFNVAGGISLAGDGAGTVAVGVGGSGGGGGEAGSATAAINVMTRSSNVDLLAASTLGANSNGITVQSLGGGGGNGGFNVTGVLQVASKGAVGVAVGVGGSGGGGGAAGNVVADVTGRTETRGLESIGVLAQSVGGGGGNGGFNVSGGISVAKSGAGNVTIGFGGSGGDGGDSRSVTLDINQRTLDSANTLVAAVTIGAKSTGIVAQSLGGGGGNGAFNVNGGISIAKEDAGNAGVGIGGSGGGGGSAGAVVAKINGDVATRSYESGGALAQSIGGGGGNGGFNISGGLAISTSGDAGNIMLGMGGFGGAGGNGGTVDATLTSDVTTVGDKSYGAVVQSLGGGGGMGAFNVSGGVSLSMGTGAGTLGVGIGGFGGGGGDAGNVKSNLTGNILTDGAESQGLLVQSQGGGGGNGGMNITGGLAVSKGDNGTIGLGFGGFGGSGGNAGTVDGKSVGTITTSGKDSYGAKFQSIGGAGGNGAMNITGGLSITKGASTSGGISVGIGGFGGGGGDAQRVTAYVDGRVQTDGASSAGVVAMSLGGGGGDGGINVSGMVSVSTKGNSGGLSFGLGGFGGDGGTAGDVTLTRIGQTLTAQSSSDGVVAQSIGGGGGRGGMNISAGISGTNGGNSGAIVIGVGGFGGGGGNAGAVTATVSDSVWAKGSAAATSYYPDDISLPNAETVGFEQKQRWADGSNGIVVQSLGGGGGSGGINVSGGISLSRATPSSKASSLVLGLGGFGGSGGDGGVVKAAIGAASGSRIQVQGMGDNKSAAYIASIGGGGGDGGINVSGSLATDGQITAGIGGFGGAGGLGRAVEAKVDADLFATGFQASGLVVQSLGGGGGNGGINVTGALRFQNGEQPMIALGMGGDGGAGNSSDKVTAQQDGQVSVTGFNSVGVLVQSVAGGGGNGGMNVTALVNQSNSKSQFDGLAVGIGVGGTGGKGSTAGDVYLRSTGDILINTVVTGADAETKLSKGSESGSSTGISVQSIGGGGGNGGFNIVGIYAPSGNPVTVAVGGSGSVGGDAGSVTVVRGKNAGGTVNRSLINTFGVSSSGLLAQSIGGGGGNAATNLSFAWAGTEAGRKGFGGLFQIGGDGASSGNAKDVDVTHLGTIQTDGMASYGILAQSIGKGGGNAAVNIGVTKLGEKTEFRVDSTNTSTVNSVALAVGGAAGDAGSAGKVTVSHDGTIITKQAMSSAIVAQSLAGGGGNVALNIAAAMGADNSLSVSIGRSGGKGGVAGDVNVSAAGLLLVSGDLSNGIVAQSIGGAGGLSGTTTVDAQLRDGSGSTATKEGAGISVGIEGGAGGLAGAVTVNNQAEIQTDGESARGIVAQSIGGDGGVAGSALLKSVGQTNSISLAVGGAGGTAARSAKVTVGNTGKIETKKANSDGVFAQSIGGGGGAAGAATTAKILPGGAKVKSSTTVAVTVGGTGGTGAIADDVVVRNDGTILTTGEKSVGIRAQSIGGGGGLGGSVYNIDSISADKVNTFNVLLGGAGGTGNAAGNVEVGNYGLIKTIGASAYGISANSIGGGGGDAGSVSNITWLGEGAGSTTNALQVAIGGSGGSGGTGGSVTVRNVGGKTPEAGAIVTSGTDAHGIFAQSLGGGGGNGSAVLSLLISSRGKETMSMGLSVGGFGGDGNTGGEVRVDNSGIINTSGDGAFGILAQSIGGGGGNGGSTLASNVIMKKLDKAPLIALGGIGGDGNDGGHVTVVNSGKIFTSGKKADGIVAQSIGGGGGSAALGLALTGEKYTLIGSNLLSLLVGKTGGGSSGSGGQVDVVHSGDITVTGEGSQAIVAESINGGGGSVEFNIASLKLPSVSNLFPGLSIPPLEEIDGIPNLVAGEPVNRPVDPVIVAARVGASDVTMMNAGKVNISITGTTGAGGDFGAGVMQRSVGGGGGSLTIGGSLVKQEDLPEGETSAQIIYAVGLGAKNTTDSAGADMDSVHTGDVLTTGKATTGVLLQSVGGGGGSALVNVGAEDVTLIDSVRLGLGGVGTSGSVGGAISRVQSGAVVTTKNLAQGGLVQSIGGGGGSALATVGVTASPTSPAQFAPAIVSLGANGGTANDGGVVDLSFTGGFSTMGDYSSGLVVQSIGGGGGTVTLDGLKPSSILIGGSNGADGAGGDVSVSNNGQVATLGEGASGVVLQSIGGGGGAVFGAMANPAVKLSAANSGSGGAVSFSQTGDIIAVGNHAYGIVAQSLGGGGGLIDTSFAGSAGGEGDGGAISLNVEGSVLAVGTDSSAILAQSLGAESGGNIDVTTSGNVRGGSEQGTGIRIDGGATNTVRSSGTLSSVSGLAVAAGVGNDAVINLGTAVGNYKLGGGNNSLVNARGATLVTIDTIDLRDGADSSGTFTNSGQLDLGLSASNYPVDLLAGERYPVRTVADIKGDVLSGTQVISRVALDGDFVQTATGNAQFDIAFGPYSSDRLDVTGKATVAGTVGVTLTWLENSNPVVLWAAAGGGVDQGLTVVDTLLLDYRVIADAQGIKLGVVSNFGLPILNANGRAVGRSLDSALQAGNSGGIGRLLTLLGNLSAGQEDTYKQIMGDIDPESLLSPGLKEFSAARDFGSSLFGCAGEDAGTKCTWARVERNNYRRNSKDGDKSFEQKDSVQLRAGIELPFQGNWALAGAIGYDSGADFAFDGERATGKSEGAHGGIAVRRNLGADGRGAISVGVAGGVQWVDMKRRQFVFVEGIGSSRFRNDYVAFNGNAKYTFGLGSAFVRPELNLSYVGIGQNKFEETGLGGLGFEGLRSRDWIATATPKLTLGANFNDFIQVSVNAGMVLHNKSSYTTPLRLIGADAAADPALISSGFDKKAFAAGADLQLMRKQRFSVDVGYRGEWGRTTASQNLRLKMALSF